MKRCWKHPVIYSLKRMLIVIVLIISVSLNAQQTQIDSLKNLISITKKDTSKIELYEKLAQAYRNAKKLDSSILTYKQALHLNRKNNYSPLKQCYNMSTIDYLYYVTGDYTKSLQYASKALVLSESLHDLPQIAHAHQQFGFNYVAFGDYRQALNHFFKAKELFELHNHPEIDLESPAFASVYIGYIYLKINQPDSALIYVESGYQLASKMSLRYVIDYSLRMLGDIYLAKNNEQLSLNYYRQYINDFYRYDENNRDIDFVFYNMAKIFQKRNQNDSAVFYAKKALKSAKEYNDQENLYNASNLLYKLYDAKNQNYIVTDKKTENIPKDNQDIFRIKIDSLKNLISETKTDTAKIDLYEKLGDAYRNEKKMDSCILSFKHALEINEKKNYSVQHQSWNMAALDYILYEMGNYKESIEYATRLLVLNEKLNDTAGIAMVNIVFGLDYKELGDYRSSIDHYFKAYHFWEIFHTGRHEAPDNTYTILCLSEAYLKMNKTDSALLYAQQGYKLCKAASDGGYILLSKRLLGDIYFGKGDEETALRYYRQYVPDYIKYKERNRDLGFVMNNMSKIFQKRNQNDSAVFYAKKALSNAIEFHDQQNIYAAATLLHNLNDSLNDESQAFIYFKIAEAAKDSMASIEKIRQIQQLTFNEQTREKELEEADAKAADRRRLVIIIASIVGLTITFLVWNRIRQLRLKHKMILDQKESEKLKAIDRMKEKFFTNITHELRTPLSLIMSPTEFYLQHPEELNDTSKLLEGIYKNSNYLLNLINQLLDISKLDSGKMNISLSKGNFGDYIGALVKTFQDEAQKKQLNLQYENNLPGEYLFDAEQWKKIMHNLLSNALKFTPLHKNIFVSLSKMSVSNNATNIQLAVKDTGIGISKEQLPYITDRFYQADNNLTRKYEGTGIGLSLVNELIKLMNGKLDIESEEEKGSTFTISMALMPATGKENYPEVAALRTDIVSSIAAVHSVPENEEADKNLPVILIAEDNESLREFMNESLSSHYKIVTVCNGAEGFETAVIILPDVIISDVMMPVMDGFEFCNKIKTTAATSHIPFIILSAKTTVESKITGLQKGADDYLLKPFSVDELRWKIKNITEKQKLSKVQKAKMEHELLELEAKALRAQMNPHFIFNCMNSIKLLIQQKDEEKAINYLTTFSKLIRTIFQNSDKREITLYDEIETCRLYMQLESLRFQNKFSYAFSIDEMIDLKLLMVPALIIQPFIENAIWHGIMPKEDAGYVNIVVKRTGEDVLCIIDDDGIGRETSEQNKFKACDLTHQSKGVHLTQSRIDLDNILNARNASLEVIDKKDEHGKATGTTVILTFKEY